MTIYASRAHAGKFAIGTSSSGTTTFRYFPRNPNHFPEPVPMFEPGARPNGTEDVCKFYTFELGWDIMTWREWYWLNRMYDPYQQLVILAYPSDNVGNPYDPNTADTVHGYGTAWVESPAVFAQKPSKEDHSAILVKGVVCRFKKVEWSVIGANNAVTNPSTDTIVHIDTLYPPL